MGHRYHYFSGLLTSTKCALCDLLNQLQLLPLDIRTVDAMYSTQRCKAAARADANVISEHFLLLPALALCDDICSILNLQWTGDKDLAITN